MIQKDLRTIYRYYIMENQNLERRDNIIQTFLNDNIDVKCSDFTTYQDLLIILCHRPTSEKGDFEYLFLIYNHLSQEIVLQPSLKAKKLNAPRIKLLIDENVIEEDYIVKWKFVVFEKSYFKPIE